MLHTCVPTTDQHGHTFRFRRYVLHKKRSQHSHSWWRRHLILVTGMPWHWYAHQAEYMIPKTLEVTNCAFMQPKSQREGTLYLKIFHQWCCAQVCYFAEKWLCFANHDDYYRSISKLTLNFLDQYLSASQVFRTPKEKKQHQTHGGAVVPPSQAVISEILKWQRQKWTEAKISDGRSVLTAMAETNTAFGLLQWCPSQALADCILDFVIPALLDGHAVSDVFRSLTPDWRKLLYLAVHLGTIRDLSPSRFKVKLQTLELGTKKHAIGIEVELFIAETYHRIRSLANFKPDTDIWIYTAVFK